MDASDRNDANHTPTRDELTAEQKERLRAAIKILIKHLLADDIPRHLRSALLDKEKNESGEIDRESTVSMDDPS